MVYKGLKGKVQAHMVHRRQRMHVGTEKDLRGCKLRGVNCKCLSLSQKAQQVHTMFPNIPLQAITIDLADTHSILLTVDRILNNSIYIPAQEVRVLHHMTIALHYHSKRVVVLASRNMEECLF